MDKLRIYDTYRKPPQEALKPFSNGKFSGTDINPMWRIWALTDAFGPCGVGWYIDDVTERCEEHDDNVCTFVTLKLFVKIDGEWSKPIYGTGGNTIVRSTKNGKSVSDEAYKMAYTDAIGVACKALGIGAEVYSGGKDSKYAQYYTDTQAAEPKPQTAEPKPQTAEPKPQTAEPKPQTAEPKPQTAEPKQAATQTAPAQRATLAQLNFIRRGLDAQHLAEMKAAYGENMERLSHSAAEKLIQRISNDEL